MCVCDKRGEERKDDQQWMRLLLLLQLLLSSRRLPSTTRVPDDAIQGVRETERREVKERKADKWRERCVLCCVREGEKSEGERKSD